MADVNVKVTGVLATALSSGSVRAWLHGFGAAVVSGAASTASSALGAMAAGYDVFDPSFWQIIGGSVVGGALVSALAYLKQSPVPPKE